jgi:formamidopyrimidine-DNA glycosylase
MPEIPEIETVKRHLEQYVSGKIISNIDIYRYKTINISPQQFTAKLIGQQVINIRRRAKILIITFSNDTSILIHFMLEGYARFFNSRETLPKRASVVLTVATGERLAFFAMNLGYIHFVPTSQLAEMPDLDNLGPEPLSPQFTLSSFREILASRRGMIKPLLMDQKIIAGIGNVYSNEILFCSRILPTRKASKLTAEEVNHLFECLQIILQQAVAAGGVYDIKFTQEDALTGGYTPQLKVAYRAGEACYVCGNPIKTKRVSGRNAFFCPVCQH